MTPRGEATNRRSVGSGPTTTSRAATTSASRRAIGPLVDRCCQSGGSAPPDGTRPRDGFIPLRPQHEDGIRIEPPPSDPVASGTMPDAMAAALPPEDPPGLWSRFQGLRVGPKTVLSVSAFHPSSGVLVFPITTQPAALSRATSAESTVAAAPPANTGEPWDVTNPAASSRSLTPMGMPGQRARVAPGRDHVVYLVGGLESGVVVEGDEGVHVALRASMRARAWVTSSRAPVRPDRTSSARAVTETRRKSMGSTRSTVRTSLSSAAQVDRARRETATWAHGRPPPGPR